MAKEKISRKEYDVMRSYLSKKKNAKVNLDDYEADEPVSHHSSNNEDMKRELKRKQNMKNTIRLTESELKSLIAESVKNILKEDDFDDAMGRGEDYDFNDRGNDPYDNGDAVYSQESETIMRAARGMGDILWIASDPSNIKGKTPADTAFWALSDIMHKLNNCLPAIVNCNDEEFWNLFPQNSPTKDKKWWRNFLQKLRGIYKDIADLEWISRQVKAQKFYNIIYKLTKDEE